MPSRTWLFIAAICLIFAASLGQAQGTQEPAGQAQAQQGLGQSFPIPLPIEIVEDEAATEARQRQEEDARRREMENLVAQQEMNSATQAMNVATEDMRDYALYSTVLIGVGTLLLFMTLALTRQANRAAQEAVSVTREVGMAQVRAHLTISDIKVLPEKRWPHFSVTFCMRNTGHTQTRQLCFSRAVELAEKEFLPVRPDNVWMKERDLGPGESVQVERFLVYTKEPQRSKVEGDRVAISALIKVRFDDVFGNTITETINCIGSGPWPFTEANLSVESRDICIALGSAKQAG